MRKLVKYSMAKSMVHGLLQLAVFAAWAEGGLQWFLPHYADWALREMQGLALLVAVPMAIALGLFGGMVVLATLQLPILAVALADNAVRWFKCRRGRA